MNDTCIYCKSTNVIKYGRRKTKERGRIQRCMCKSCKRTFCEDDGFKWKHHSSKTIIDALELFVAGNSLRFVAQFLEVAKDTILRWVFEYARLLDKHVDRFRQKFTDMLHMDELFMKMCNTFYYWWVSICRDTRIATVVFAQQRTTKYAKQLLSESPCPLESTTDGAFTYGTVIRSRFGTWWYRYNYHRCVEFKDKKNNNLMERFNNTVRSLTHKRRGYKGLETGRWQARFVEIYYNFVKYHMAIKQTPAEKANLVEYFGCKNEKSRWRFLIKEAARGAYFYLTLWINRILGQSLRFRNT